MLGCEEVLWAELLPPEVPGLQIAVDAEDLVS
jgi:hypothetical protein